MVHLTHQDKLTDEADMIYVITMPMLVILIIGYDLDREPALLEVNVGSKVSPALGTESPEAHIFRVWDYRLKAMIN